MTPRVAIIGSCVTRDAWNIAGFPDDDRPDLLYVSRTSIASLMSRPVEGFKPPEAPTGDLTGWEMRMVVDDILKRGLDRLSAYQPTHLIIDLIDERFELMAAGSAIFNFSWEFVRSELGDTSPLSEARRISRSSDEATTLWCDALERFADWLRTNLPHTQVIFHDARWATHHLTEDRRWGLVRFVNERLLWPGVPARIDTHNSVLDHYARHFRATFPKARLVRAAPWWRFGDPKHQWGLSPFHYVQGYYRDIWNQFRRVGCDPRSG